jgi:NodT family efflux transporter outer membrane factor (OMF) lipoprotein
MRNTQRAYCNRRTAAQATDLAAPGRRPAALLAGSRCSIRSAPRAAGSKFTGFSAGARVAVAGGVTPRHPALLLLLAAVAGCSAPAQNVKPDVELRPGFTASGGVSVPDRWWTAIDDPTLHRLIEEGLARNPGLAATWDRLAQAEASARAAGASALPSVSGDAGGSISLRDGELGGSLSVGLAASYEIDLWGGIGASRDAAGIDAWASAADLRAAGVTLSAEIGLAWYRLVEQRALSALLDEQLANAERTLALVELRFEHGAVAETDLLRQRQSAESIRGEMASAAARVDILSNRLAILLGHAPGHRLPAATAPPMLPPMPDTGVPGELLTRRPDLVSAHLSIQSTDKRVAAAISQRFPRLNLGARLSTSGLDPTELVTGWISSISASIAQTLFDAGKKKAEVERVKAQLSAQIHGYEAAVLAAMAEVEDAIANEVHHVDVTASLVEQTALARGVAERTERAYAAGAVDYLRVLDAEGSLQSLERRRVSAAFDHIEYRIALYRALAGGFEMSKPN